MSKINPESDHVIVQTGQGQAEFTELGGMPVYSRFVTLPTSEVGRVEHDPAFAQTERPTEYPDVTAYAGHLSTKLAS